MHLQAEVERLRKSLTLTDQIQTELDRRIFHLKTLYDISKEIYGSVNTGVILRNFLLMTTGNFGMVEGFVAIADANKRELVQFVSLAVQSGKSQELRERSLEICLNERLKGTPLYGAAITEKLNFPITLECALPFVVHEGWTGVLGLGEKIIGEPCSENDKELLDTLLFNLAIALKNARSFEEIEQLNSDLQAKNDQLEAALSQLQASMRKVEILESIKENLSKFVPVTVSRLIEKSPTNTIPQSRRQDLSILFLDIEGYTTLVEKLGGDEINRIIEEHFSVFMDAIYANNGDVNETAGDGLMVLFFAEDAQANALDAARAAVKIKQETVRIKEKCLKLDRPLHINMGINSGQALVGAARFDSYTGSRWTYTARGSIVNIAARIGAFATGGNILLSKSTADRIKGHFNLEHLGRHNLKNVSDKIDIFQIVI
jgi:class 3 adenylate cyclase